ncbi:MAG TPA: adenylate cyclase, partial [Pseudonocardiaceae bacterium]|nr:adenylate cyclase [Pseudonocardiaceae bacterium]
YRPSGREPVLHVGSRRGVPYLPKPGRQLYGERSSGPRFFTPDHIARTLAGADRPQAALLTCALRELAWAHYRELFTAHPVRTTMDWPEFAERFAAIPITDPGIERLVECAVPDPADRVDFGFLRSPLTGLRFADQSALDRWMVDRIDTTVRRATDPGHSAHAAVSHGLRTVADQVESLLDTGDHQAGLVRFVGRLAGLTAFTGSGPPPHRLAQLAALVESGVVRFLGANLRISCDAGCFVATTDSLPSPVTARHLIEARLPEPDIRSGTDPLLAGLGARQDRLPVAQGTFQVLDERGMPHPRRLAMGAFASGGALGSFARPGRDAAFFRQNDAAARWLLEQLSGSSQL